MRNGYSLINWLQAGKLRGIWGIAQLSIQICTFIFHGINSILCTCNLNRITLANHTAVLTCSWGTVFTYSRQQAWSRSWLWTVGIWGGTGWWSAPGSNLHTVSCSCRCRATDTLALKAPYNELKKKTTKKKQYNNFKQIWYFFLFSFFLLVLKYEILHIDTQRRIQLQLSVSFIAQETYSSIQKWSLLILGDTSLWCGSYQ